MLVGSGWFVSLGGPANVLIKTNRTTGALSHRKKLALVKSESRAGPFVVFLFIPSGIKIK